MTVYAALLRAVNVGGTGKLPMEALRAMCAACGFAKARTYIASGNVVFEAEADEATVKAALEKVLADYAGRPVEVMVRTGPELAAALKANPFGDAPANRNMVVFLDAAPPADVMTGVTGQQAERIAPGRREIYVLYDEGMAHSKLKIPAATKGTARNMNTVAKLAEWTLEGSKG
jgi:uncharacterized protein (DUF1697 family)